MASCFLKRAPSFGIYLSVCLCWSVCMYLFGVCVCAPSCLACMPSFGGELGWPNYGPHRSGRSVYGPYPSFCCSGVSVSVWAAAGRLLWWGGGVRCFAGVNLSSSISLPIPDMPSTPLSAWKMKTGMARKERLRGKVAQLVQYGKFSQQNSDYLGFDSQ